MMNSSPFAHVLFELLCGKFIPFLQNPWFWENNGTCAFLEIKENSGIFNMDMDLT